MERRPLRHRSRKAVQIPDVLGLKEDVYERSEFSCLFTEANAHARELTLEVVDDLTHRGPARGNRGAPSGALSQRPGQADGRGGRQAPLARRSYDRGLTGENPGPRSGPGWGSPGIGGP